MRLITFRTNGAERIGAFIDNDQTIIDLATAGGDSGASAETFADMQSLIEGGEGALDAARKAEAHGVATGTGAIKAAGVEILAPLPRPLLIRDFLGFEEHVRNTNYITTKLGAQNAPEPAAVLKRLEEEGAPPPWDVWYEIPLFYKPNPLNVVGTGVDVIWPRYSEKFDYELEFGCFIGKPGKDIAKEDAMDHVFGYTVFNDFSARDTIAHELGAPFGPLKGKDFDTGKVMGPCIVTADAFDPYAADMIVRVNGDERSRGNSSTMHWSFADFIAYVSRCETLHAGEFLASGTVGRGCGLEIEHYLEPNDVVELEVEGIGIIRKKVIRP